MGNRDRYYSANPHVRYTGERCFDLSGDNLRGDIDARACDALLAKLEEHHTYRQGELQIAGGTPRRYAPAASNAQSLTGSSSAMCAGNGDSLR